MRLNDKIIERFDLTSDVSSQQILKTIADNRKKEEWTDMFVTDNIDYKEIDIKDNKLEIIRKPGMLSAFRPDGKITIDIVDIPDNKTTRLKCEIFPYNGSLPLRIGFLIVILSIWSLILLIVTPTYVALLMIILPWGIFGLIFYLRYLYTKNGLIDYSKKVIAEITRVRKASS